MRHLTGRHKSIPRDLTRLLKLLNKQEGVSRVIPGPIQNCSHKYAPGHIKLMGDVGAGLKAKGFFGDGVMTLYIYLSSDNYREQVKTYVNKLSA